MRSRLLVSLVSLVAVVSATAGCADGEGFCGGAAIEVRPALEEPITETSIACAGPWASLCDQPTVVINDVRCDSPQLELTPGHGGDPWIGVILVVEDGVVVSAIASGNDGDQSHPVGGGWLQLFQGSLLDQVNLSGELDIAGIDGARVAGRFSALTNPAR